MVKEAFTRKKNIIKPTTSNSKSSLATASHASAKEYKKSLQQGKTRDDLVYKNTLKLWSKYLIT